MELRTAQSRDIPALHALWHEAFGDDRAAIDAFFQTCYKPENTLIAAENGMPVSVLYWIEADIDRAAKRFRRGISSPQRPQKARVQKGICPRSWTMPAGLLKNGRSICCF